MIANMHMKLSKYIILLLSCAVMTLSLQAQDSISNDTTSKESIAESTYMADMEGEEQSKIHEMEDGQPSYAYLGISIITLIGIAFLLFITVKKKPKMESENNNENEIWDKRADELQSIKTQLQQIQDLLLKQAELLNQFASQVSNLQITNSNILQQKEADVRYVQQCTQQPLPVDVSTSEKTVLDVAPEKIFIATASVVDNKVILRVVEEQYANQAAFEIKVKGDMGIYYFNPLATKALLNYADTKIKPYCDITIDSGKVPSRIDTSVDGMIESCGDEWLVTKKAQIHIS